MTNQAGAEQQAFVLGSDAPQTDPQQDAFGYTPFAKRIAAAICTTQSPQGLVMAIHGPWGSGKSSLLNFVRFEVEASPERDRPLIIAFNPWWFSNRDDLVTQFLKQFREQLPKQSDAVKRLGNMLSEYSAALGTAVSTATGVPLIDVGVSWLLKLFRIKPKSVHEAKKDVTAGIQSSGRRFVFIIDDIDRLTPGEICELFKVLKALADFPNVIYLLAFDRTVVAQALGRELRVDGQAYLEKIVQAPFQLPVVSRQKLHDKLVSDLNLVLREQATVPFDNHYWGNVYHEGLEQLIQKPRDIVRIVNALVVTYPAVRDEVNAVDFIALEFLRVFLPSTYATVRDHREHFAGYSDPGFLPDRQEQRAFHDGWVAELPAALRSGICLMLQRVFPRLEGVFGNMVYGADFLTEWRRDLRVCSPDRFVVYFQFGVAADTLSNQDIRLFTSLGDDEQAIAAALVSAARVTRPGGYTKAHEFVRRLRDTQGLTPAFARAFVRVALRVGDQFLTPADAVGAFHVSTGVEVSWLLQHLLEVIPHEEREALVIESVDQGQALCTLVEVVQIIDRHVRQGTHNGTPSLYTSFSVESCDRLRSIALQKIASAATEGELLEVPDPASVLVEWRAWGDSADIRRWLEGVVASDEMLPRLLVRFVQQGMSTVVGDRVGRITASINPRMFSPELDLDTVEVRVQAMAQLPGLPSSEQEAVQLFLAGMTRMRQGRGPRDPIA
jgi:predicted KAP-like P-loop ATPase